MAEIIQFPKYRNLKDGLNSQSCLEQAKNLNLKDVVVAGYTQEGNFFFSASENITNESSLFLLEIAKLHIFKNVK